MDCPICRDLERAYKADLSDYGVARSSACYRVSTELAAQKNVDLERARYELEEHRLVGRWLLFGTGGVAVTNINYQAVFTDDYAPAMENGGVIAKKTGWSAGAGVEYQVQPPCVAEGRVLARGLSATSRTPAPISWPRPVSRTPTTR